MEKKYIVETGKGYSKKIKGASSLEGAVQSAFILYPPRNPGVLTRVKEDIQLNTRKKESMWQYIDSKVMLKKAGYKVKK
ncbi:MAG: hypothetical protein AABY22_33140 [Nanoarchaeota archaeon]